jgi:hypothetical protein
MNEVELVLVGMMIGCMMSLAVVIVQRLLRDIEKDVVDRK